MKKHWQLIVLSFDLAGSVAQAGLTESEFNSLHASVQPNNEAWATIPWHPSLAPAQRQAVEEGKPLFIWAMDGHPLGCT